MMDALGETALEDLSLQSSLQEILDLQGQHVIEAHLGLIKHTNSDQSSDQGVTLEQSLGVLGLELEELSSSTSDFGEGEGNAPDFALVSEPVFASELLCDGRDRVGW